ncbi:MAG: hypothetical protein AB1490_00040 [Pseudomonadota bacterium]
MSFRFTQIVLAACALLAGATAAHAFTFQDGGQGGQGQYAVPKFDLEEQAKQFRAGGSKDASKWETPLGSGKLQFGVQQNGQPSSRFAPGFSPTPGYPSNNAHFERILTPENFR